jgi:iron-sulfur cluster assembly accessory protein
MVTLTETAAKKISELRLEEGKPEWGLRIRIVGGGCSGCPTSSAGTIAAAEDDNVVESQGVKVFVDAKSAQ